MVSRMDKRSAGWWLIVSSLSSILLLPAAAEEIRPQIEQARQLEQTGPPVFPNEDTGIVSDMPDIASESPGDEDLGQQLILKRKQDVKTLFVFAETNANYTSNVGLTDGFEEEDWFWHTSFGAIWQPRLASNLIGNVSISQDFFRYDAFSELDFDSLNVGAGLTYNLWFFHNVSASLQLNYNRLTTGNYNDEFFSNKSVILGLAKNFLLSRAHYIYAGGGANLGWSNPSEAQRNEYALYLGYHVRLARRFELDASYRVAINNYTDIDRTDLNQTIDLGVRYHFTPWSSAAAFVSGGFNDSDRTGFDYNVLNTGAGISLNLRF